MLTFNKEIVTDYSTQVTNNGYQRAVIKYKSIYSFTYQFR